MKKVKSFSVKVNWQQYVSSVTINYRLSKHKKDRVIILNFWNCAMTKANIYSKFKAIIQHQ